jgi:hypothetical protein
METYTDTFVRIVFERIFVVLLDLISLAWTSGRDPIAHLVSEKALSLHVGTGG